MKIFVDINHIRNEIAVRKRISVGHQTILSLIYCFETSRNYYVVTETACGGDLFDCVNSKRCYCDLAAADLIRVEPVLPNSNHPRRRQRGDEF